MKKPEAVRWEKLEGEGDSLKLKQFIPGLLSEFSIRSFISVIFGYIPFCSANCSFKSL